MKPIQSKSRIDQLKGLVCPVSKQALFMGPTGLQTEKGEAQYPLLRQTIPVLVDHNRVFLTNTLIQLERYLKERQGRYEQMRQDTGIRYFRSEAEIHAMIEGFTQNDGLLTEVRDAIQDLVDTEDIKSHLLAGLDMAQGYIFSFSYLIRDWAQTQYGEAEISLIKEKLSPHLPDQAANQLFLGGGMARLACELSSFAEQTITLDSSLTLAYLFEEVRERDIPFFEENLKNIQTKSDLLVPRTASSQGLLTEQKEKVHNIVADAAQMPFADQGISAVYSIYFSDVIPFPHLIREIQRVLVEGGTFIHYGPLDFHFQDYRFMLSCEEFELILRRHGFQLTAKESFQSTHCRSEVAKSYKTYTIWLIVAEKQTVLPPIDQQTRFSIPEAIQISHTGKVDNTDFQFDSALILPDQRRFEGAETVIDLLQTIDGKRTFSEIIAELSEIYGPIEEAHQQQLQGILWELAKKNAIQIINE